jgi:hypothetical protein
MANFILGMLTGAALGAFAALSLFIRFVPEVLEDLLEKKKTEIAARAKGDT